MLLITFMIVSRNADSNLLFIEVQKFPWASYNMLSVCTMSAGCTSLSGKKYCIGSSSVLCRFVCFS